MHLLHRLPRFRRQTRAEQLEKIRRCRLSRNPESDLPLILNRQTIFRSLSEDEQIQYAWDMYEVRHSLGRKEHHNMNVLFFCPLITQYIQTTRGRQFVKTGTNNWFEWFAENQERYTWDMTQEEELILQNHIFQYQIMRPLPHQPVRLPPIQQYPLPQTPLPRLEDQLQLPQPVYQQPQPDASSGEHSHHQYHHYYNY